MCFNVCFWFREALGKATGSRSPIWGPSTLTKYQKTNCHSFVLSPGFALPPSPLAAARFLGAGLVSSQYSDRLAGLLVFCCLVFVWLVLSVGICAGLLVSRCHFPCHFLVFAAASLQPSAIAHCFKALGSHRFGGLLGCWVSVVWFFVLLKLKCMLARWLLDVSS